MRNKNYIVYKFIYLLNTIKCIYRNTKVRIKFNDGISEPIHINKGEDRDVASHQYYLTYTLIKLYRNLK